MIRRDWPLGAAKPERWVLVTQPDHARLSWELASAWGGPNVPPLVCLADEVDHPLAGVRRELLDAILHHDDGWHDRLDTPRIDPEHDRPYTFTEMPPADAQRISRDSVDVCREFGPLSGWVVASHFKALQAKRPGRHVEWEGWLRHNDVRRSEWLAKWLAESDHHTQELADRCLAQLQAFDWATLWLCLRGPMLVSDQGPAEPLTIGGSEAGWPPVRFVPRPAARGTLEVTPWPFVCDSLQLTTVAAALRVELAGSDELMTFSDEASLAWTLLPSEADAASGH